MYKKKILLIIAFLVIVVSLLNIKDFYTKITIPVEGDKLMVNWDEKSFWYYPWGESDIHRGIDIFGDLDAPILSPVRGIVVKSGFSANGGNYIYILSYDLKTYYFAHLNKRLVKTFSLVDTKDIIGLMGDTGNAKFSQFHLHFSIFSIVPIVRFYDRQSIKGWQKMFYLNPEIYFYR